MVTTEAKPKPLVLWKISCFDKRSPNPLPLDGKSYALDWSLVSPDEEREILSILNGQERDTERAHPADMNEVIVTVTHGFVQRDRRMLEYRRCFKECDVSKFAPFSADDLWRQPLYFVPFDPDYTEDETGAPITQLEMFRHLSGHDDFVLMGDVESVLRFGPTEPINVEAWKSESADTISQFLSVVE